MYIMYSLVWGHCRAQTKRIHNINALFRVWCCAPVLQCLCLGAGVAHSNVCALLWIVVVVWLFFSLCVCVYVDGDI